MPLTRRMYRSDLNDPKPTLSELLFDHRVGAREHGCRHVEAERLGGLEVDHQVVLGWRLHRKVCWLLALEDAIDVAGRAAKLVDNIRLSLLKISTGLRQAGDFREPAVPSRSW
jgi:hypothetical protein